MLEVRDKIGIFTVREWTNYFPENTFWLPPPSPFECFPVRSDAIFDY